MLPSTVPVNRNGSCKHHAEAAAQIGEVHLFHVDAVDSDRAFLHIVEAQQQGNDRGLAGTGVADNGDRLAGFDGERNVAQNPVGLVAELLDLRARPHTAIAGPSVVAWSRAPRPRSCRHHRLQPGCVRYANHT